MFSTKRNTISINAKTGKLHIGQNVTHKQRLQFASALLAAELAHVTEESEAALLHNVVNDANTLRQLTIHMLGEDHPKTIDLTEVNK